MTYELEIWYDQKKLKRMLTWVFIISAVLIAGAVIGYLCMDEYTTTFTRRGRTYKGGWPVWLQYYGGPIGILLPILVWWNLRSRNSKKPMLALNQDGLLINMQMVKDTFVPWNEIQRISTEQLYGQNAMAIYFKNPDDIVQRQPSGKRSFLKSALKDGKALVLDTRLTSDNMEEFIKRAQQFSNVHP